MDTKVTLLTYTADPIRTLTRVWQASRDNLPIDYGKSEEECKELFLQIVRSALPIAEMIDFVFLLEGVSVAFREQMVRHRVGVKIGDRLGVDIVPDLGSSSWWSQSMRVLNMGSFADDEAYEIPESVEQKGAQSVAGYKAVMNGAQTSYRRLVELGIPEEDARLVLPLATQHRIVWKLNLASLIHVIGKRGCWILQLGFWGPIIEGMVTELCRAIHPVFRSLLRPPCWKDETYEGCLFELDNQQRLSNADPLPPCAIYLAEEQPHEKLPSEVNKKQFSSMCRRYAVLWGMASPPSAIVRYAADYFLPEEKGDGS